MVLSSDGISGAQRTVRDLGVQIQQTTGLWKKSDIEKRTADLVEFVLGRWPLWNDA